MKRALYVFLPAMLLISCANTQAFTAKDFCDFKFPRDLEKQKECMLKQSKEAELLFNKLVSNNVIDKDGKLLLYAKNRVPYKIYKQCWTRNSPDYWLMNYCFDHWLDMYNRTGRWGMNSPSWQW